MKIKKSCKVLFLACLLLSACHPNKMTTIPIGVSDMTPIHCSQPINLINDQDEKEIHEYSENTNLTQWSDIAIKLVEQWFDKNNIQHTEGAEKYLRISISDAITDNKKSVCTQLKLNIETSTGLQRSYPARECGAGPYTSASYAINYAVVELMHDGSIINYLEN